ncbi:MAG: helix-turn-helix domain-containing protein [Pseudomonadota bacterium]
MSRSNKFDYQMALENSLIAHPEGLSLDELVAHTGLKVDRSTLFRHMSQLIEQGRVERVGKARASRYRSLNPAQAVPDPHPPGTQHPAIARAPESAERRRPEVVPAQPLPRTGSLEPTPVSSPTTEPIGNYDAVVKKAVRTIVREWKRCNRVNLQIYLSLLVKPDVLDELAEVVEKELAGLREDDLDRFGLTPMEYSRFIPSEPARRPETRQPR